MRLGWSSVRAAARIFPQPTRLTTPNFQPIATQEREDQRGNQHYSRELLMMGTVIPKTC